MQILFFSFSLFISFFSFSAVFSAFCAFKHYVQLLSCTIMFNRLSTSYNTTVTFCTLLPITTFNGHPCKYCFVQSLCKGPVFSYVWMMDCKRNNLGGEEGEKLPKECCFFCIVGCLHIQTWAASRKELRVRLPWQQFLSLSDGIMWVYQFTFPWGKKTILLVLISGKKQVVLKASVVLSLIVWCLVFDSLFTS